MKILGILSGTVLLHGQGIFAGMTEETVETPFGPAQVFRAPGIAFIARHGKDPGRHILPHLINHPANLSALSQLGAREVIGVHSTGALKRRLRPGMLIVPDDYIMPYPGPTAVRGKPVHITPALDRRLRERLLEAAWACAAETVDGGVYWQTAGPRLETKAEISMMARFADVVGMTMASEAICAQETGIPFASLCSVDNLAHGLGEQALTTETIVEHARRNAETILRILERFLEQPLPGS